MSSLLLGDQLLFVFLIHTLFNYLVTFAVKINLVVDVGLDISSHGNLYIINHAILVTYTISF